MPLLDRDKEMAGSTYDAEGWAATRKPRRSSPKAFVEQVVRESAVMRESRDWSRAGHAHVVALYAWCHEQCYGIEPAELYARRAFLGAVQLAKSLCEGHLGGDVEALAEFVHWTWARELGRERWRRENKVGGQRIGFRLQFSPSLLTDWRADKLRRGGA